MTDYYRLLSTFTTAVRSEVDLNLDQANYDAARGAFDREHAPLTAAVTRYEVDELPARFAAWLASRADKSAAASAGSSAANPTAGGSAAGGSGSNEALATGASAPAGWQILEFVEAKTQSGAPLVPLDDGSLLAGGKAADSDTYTLVARTSQMGISGLRLEALADDSLPHHGPGRAGNGNFALSDIRVTAAPADREKEVMPVKLAAARATFEQPKLPVAAAIDEDKKSAWGRRWANRQRSGRRLRLRDPGRIRGRHSAVDHAQVRNEYRTRHRSATPGDCHRGGAGGARCAGRTDRTRARSNRFWPEPARRRAQKKRAPRCCAGSKTSTRDGARWIAPRVSTRPRPHSRR